MLPLWFVQIIMSLEEDAAGQKMQLAYRLQQVAALVENKVTDLWLPPWPLNLDSWTYTLCLSNWVVDQEDESDQWTACRAKLQSTGESQQLNQNENSKLSSLPALTCDTPHLWHLFGTVGSKRERRALLGIATWNGQDMGTVLEGHLQCHRDLCYSFLSLCWFIWSVFLSGECVCVRWAWLILP